MRRSNIKKLLIIVFSLSLAAPFLSSVDAAPPQDVVNAANNGLQNFVKKEPKENLHQLGFSNQKEADEAILGPAFQIFTVAPSSILANEETQNLQTIATPTSMWQFLIMSKEKSASLLTVDQVDNKWTAVSLGSSGNAKQLGKILKKYPESQGYKHRLIRIYQATSDYVELSKNNAVIGYIPLGSGRIAMELSEKEFREDDIYNSSVILTKIRPVVRKNIESDKKF